MALKVQQIREVETLEELTLSGNIDENFGLEGEEALELEVIEGLRRPLYEIEEELTIIFESAGLVEAASDLEEQYLAELGTALKTAVAKRDAVVRFLKHLDAQMDFADKEIERISERRNTLERAKDRMEGYVIRILETFERDPRGRAPRLEGETSRMSLQANPGHVEIIDEAAVPASFKLVSASMPLPLWEEVLDALEIDLRARVEEATGAVKSRVSLSAVARAIKANAKVDGADFKLGGNRLVVK